MHYNDKIFQSLNTKFGNTAKRMYDFLADLLLFFFEMTARNETAIQLHNSNQIGINLGKATVYFELNIKSKFSVATPRISLLQRSTLNPNHCVHRKSYFKFEVNWKVNGGRVRPWRKQSNAPCAKLADFSLQMCPLSQSSHVAAGKVGHSLRYLYYWVYFVKSIKIGHTK